MEQFNVMREFILNWINTHRDSNKDLFYTMTLRIQKKINSGQIISDEYGILQNVSWPMGRWPENFDFNILPDAVLICEYSTWMMKSMRQR